MNSIAQARCGCIVLMLLCAPILHAQLSWDLTPGTAGIQVAGDGTWDTTLANWHNGTTNVAWNNTTNASTTAVFGAPSPTATTGGTITVSGTINVGGLKFLPFASTPNPYAYTFTGGTLAFANDAIIEMGDVTSTGSTTNQFINISSAMTGNNLTIQRSATASTGTFQYLRFAGTNPNLTGTLTIKSTSASLGNFVLVASAAAHSGLSRIIVESGSVYAPNGTGSNYAVPMTIGGIGQNSGAIRLDAANMIFSGAITLSATSLIHSNTSGTGVVFSGAIGQENGSQGLQRSAVTATSTVSFTGASNFTGAVTLGRSGATGGVTILDFSGAGAPVSNIFYNGVTAGALNFVGATNAATTLNIVGKAGTANSQQLGPVSTAAGTLALLNVSSGSGGSMDVSLGPITRATTGLIAITGPASGTIATTTAEGFMGPWATYRSGAGITSWARVSSGVLTGFTGDLAYTTGTAVSALGGYGATKNLAISSASTGPATVTGAATDINTVSMTDNALDRTLALGSSTLRLGATGGIQLITGARNLTVSGGSLTVGGANNTSGQLILTNGSTTSLLHISSNIVANGSGTVTLLVNGVSGSKTVLSGTNVLGGGANIASGVVELRSNGALGSTGTVTVFEGAAIQLGGGITLSRTVSIAGGGVASDGALRNIAGDNTISGLVTTVMPTRIHADSGTLTLFNTNAATNVITASSTSNTLTFSGAGNIVVSSRINHTTQGTFKEGTGVLTLGGDNSVITSGGFTVNGGVLRVTNANALGANTGTSNTGATTVSSGGTLELAFAADTSLLEPITFDGAGFNGTGAVRNVSGNNSLTGILGVGAQAVTTLVADSGTTLTIAGTLRSAASSASARTVSFGGLGTINVTGTITNGTTPGTYMTGIAKIDSGTVNLRSASTFAPALTSATTAATILTTVRGGILNLDFANATPATNLIFTSNNLSMAGGTLQLTGKAATTNSQSFISTTLAGGRSKLDLNSGAGGTVNLALGTILRANSSGSVLDITLPATGTVTTTSLNLGGYGILNGGMTVSKTTWATSAATQSAATISWADAGDTIAVGNLANGTQVSFTGTAPAGLTAGVTYYVVNSTASNFQVAVSEGGAAVALTNNGTTAQMNTSGAITGLTTYSPAFASNANVDVAAGAVTQGLATVNSLRFNSATGTSLTLTDALTSLTGGILVTPNVTGNVTVQGDSAALRVITNSTSDFTVHHHGSGQLTFGPAISVTAVGFTKTGAGTMNFEGVATSAAVQIRATEGTLNFVGSNRFTGTDPALFIGSVDAAAKVSFGNGASVGAESFTGITAVGTTSSLVGSGSALYTISMQNAGVNDWRNLMIGGTGTNENNLSVEGFSAGTIQFGTANTYAGRTNIARSTFEVSVLANAGTASSLGTGALVPAIDMNDYVQTQASVATLRYVGTTDSVTDRPIRLYTNGNTMTELAAIVENNGTGTLKFTTAFTAAGTTTLSRTFRLSGTNTGANEIVSMTDGPTSVVKLDKAGTGRWTLTGNSTYTGGTTVSNGTLQLGNGGTAGMVGSGDIAVSAGATLSVNRSDSFTISNNIAGAGALVVASPAGGKVTLSSMNNTYSGGTTVSSGTLVFTNVNSGSATGSGNVIVASGATLAGTGILAPAAGSSVTIGGMLSVGQTATNAATMTLVTTGAGSLAFDSTGVLVFDLISGAGSGSLNGAAAADRLAFGGTMRISSGATLRVQNSNSLTGWTQGDAWQLMDWSTLSGMTTDTFTTLDLPALDSGLTWDTSGFYTTGIITVVPEPSRALLLGVAFAALGLRRRR